MITEERHVVPSSLARVFVGVALVILTLLVYCRSFDYPFLHYDDPSYVTTNRHVQQGLTADSVRWAFTTFFNSNWHPLTWLSLQLDYDLHGGLKAGGFHLTNVLLHAASTLLLFLVLTGMTGLLWRSAAGGGPLRPASPACGIGGMGRGTQGRAQHVVLDADVGRVSALCPSARGRALCRRRPGIRRRLAGQADAGDTAMCPALARLLAPAPLAVDRRSLAPVDGFPALVVTGESASVRPGVGLVRRHISCPAPRRLRAISGGVSTGRARREFSARLCRLPGQSNLADAAGVVLPPSGAGVSALHAVGAGVLLASISFLVLGPGRRWPYLAVGWLWFVGTLVPVIGLVQVGGQAMADRYTYVPLIGLSLLAVWGVSDLAQAWRLSIYYLIAASAVVLFACTALSWVQIGYWRNDEALWAHTVEVTSHNAVGHSCLGMACFVQGRFEEARREFEEARQIDPRSPMPPMDLGNVSWAQNRRDEALQWYRTAVELDSRTSMPHQALGLALRALGQYEEAEVEYQAVIRLEPENATAYQGPRDRARRTGPAGGGRGRLPQSDRAGSN